MMVLMMSSKFLMMMFTLFMMSVGVVIDVVCDVLDVDVRVGDYDDVVDEDVDDKR